jgi:spermidine/putrescine transport system ATP-binding protein
MLVLSPHPMAVTATPASRASGADSRGAGIELRGVSKRYGGNVALRDISLQIEDGEFFCLLGPSGCGKTTTLNLIGGFVGPTDGTIWLRGERIDTLPPHKRPVNTVFQSYALFPHMSVRDNVAFGLRMDRVKRSPSSGSRNSAIGRRRSSRAASNSASRSHARSSSVPPCSFSTSRSGHST